MIRIIKIKLLKTFTISLSEYLLFFPHAIPHTISSVKNKNKNKVVGGLS
jgi:hypothetical protein